MENKNPTPVSTSWGIPKGWKLVPEEPTQAMIDEACQTAPHVIMTYTKPEERNGSIPLIPLATWRAMIAASPTIEDETDAEVARILAMSDEEVLAEAKAEGVDLEADSARIKGLFAAAREQASISLLAKALQASIDIMSSYKRMGYGDEVYMDTLCQAIRDGQRALDLHGENPPPAPRENGND